MQIFSRGDDALILSLRRAERLFRSAPRENLTPAAQWLWDNARALYALARQPARGMNGREFDRLRGFCRELALRQPGPLRETALCQALRQAAEERPWTVRELRALPDML
ncbi:MAG: hypothetical protein IJ214_06005, partial [Clostridia bacterium]|nr:hypothetical protein [Clostridia bacterium]